MSLNSEVNYYVAHRTPVENACLNLDFCSKLFVTWTTVNLRIALSYGIVWAPGMLCTRELVVEMVRKSAILCSQNISDLRKPQG